MARNLYTREVRVSFDHLMLAVGVFESCDAIKGLWDGVVVHVLNGNRGEYEIHSGGSEV